MDFIVINSIYFVAVLLFVVNLLLTHSCTLIRKEINCSEHKINRNAFILL